MVKLTIQRLASALMKRARHQVVLFFSRTSSRKAVVQSGGGNVLVLCYGNIYRSPLVEFLFKKNNLLSDFSIKSAGFFRKNERACEKEYLSLLKNRGYDLSSHKSSVVSEDDLGWADIIIIMDRKNWDQVYDADSVASKKIVWVGAFNRFGSVEVADPYGKGDEVTEDIIRQLEKCVDNISMVLVR